MTRVVHCKKEKHDVYIGRKYNVGIEHFGNPWSHLPHANALLADTREESIENCRKWLEKEDFLEVETERRDWILGQLPGLKGKTMGCWCLQKPIDYVRQDKQCHGETLLGLIEKLR